ncbi:uncharacterized protein V1518DRAFT_100945 [Limtongia smithiae]|uniref:uncharacterized protein n=1 Tax=Limtongia smithiae TaxID=1125753 RepID=UPI0034CF71A8
MKFGKYLAKRQLELPEYASYFINYKGLKKLIKSLGADPANKTSRPENIQAALQAHKVTFFFRLERELEKVNEFYLQKEAELKLRLSALLEKKKTVKSKLGAVVKTSATFIALYEGFFRFRRDLDKLEQFVELNATGFSKVLKKWDKRSKSQTKELYLSTAVEAQPVFHREEIAELSDLATTSLLELEAWADGEDVSFDHKLAEVTQIERTNEELDMEFLRNVTRESETAIHEWIGRLQQTPDANERITRIFLLSISSGVSDSTLRALYETNCVNLLSKDVVNDRTVLHEAAISGRNVVLDFIIAHPQQISAEAMSMDIYGRTPLHYACIHGQDEMIKPLLGAGAPIDAQDQDNFTPLLFAISQNHAKCVELLIECGARVDPAGESDYIPLSMACQKGLYSITELLLKSHAAIIADAEGLYPQHLIAQAGHFKLIPLLKEYGADINTIDKLNGWIALFYAASEGHYETVKALLAAGADLSFVDNKDLPPLYYAAWEGHLDCMQLLLAAGARGGPLALPGFEALSASSLRVPAPVVDTDAMDFDMTDVDAIPDLSLPPPILPLRRYGHNFLDKKTFIEILFDKPSVSVPPNPMPLKSLSHSASSSLSKNSIGRPSSSAASVAAGGQPPVNFYSDSNIPAAKLTVSSKLLDVIPRSLLLPLADDLRTLSFQVDNLEDFSIDFEIYPTFGSRIIAKTVALSHIFTTPTGIGQCTLPLFDLRLQVIGDLTFKFNIIKPYDGTPLDITNSDVYWKSTSQVEPSTASPMVPSSLTPVIGSGFGGAVTGGAGMLSSSFASSIQPSSYSSHHMPHTQVHSLVTASSLSGCYARVCVQLTKDAVPIVYPYWSLQVAPGLSVPVCSLTYEQVRQLSKEDAAATERKRKEVSEARTAADACQALYMSLMTLADALEQVTCDVNLDLGILYPTDAERKYLGVAAATTLDLNTYIDVILNVVFDHARKVRRRGTGEDAEGRGQNRSLIFSSHHPNVCTVLNWKQPNYPVFFCIDLSNAEQFAGATGSTTSALQFRSAHDLPVMDAEDRRCGSLREATTFASSNNLMGLICSSRLLNIVPALIESIRVSGLVLVAQNNKFERFDANGVGAARVDGVRDDYVLEFNETIDM